MQATTTRPKVTATTDGEGAVSCAGSRLLADVADQTTLTAQLAEALTVLGRLAACGKYAPRPKRPIRQSPQMGLYAMKRDRRPLIGVAPGVFHSTPQCSGRRSR